MHRKVVAIGNSKGVSIPVEIPNKLDLAAGSDVNVELDEEQERIVITPVRKTRKVPGIDKEFAGQVNEFIEKYRPALKELAKK
ncbi:MAG: AbrB/MazE/SpoVT family DNA-binding domain-containing protein [Nitrospirae bacterium]|nr:AbrB/MazE/SpoVT family DNA-binding domain-containing protein [Nitrospirota bacterium]NTW66332.1 AbrB/MazE/SpoVT family DNA-binding domain-containing protein [Nitrospirota bacterium]